MVRRWLSAHKSLVVTVTSGTVVAALVATAAIVSGGYTAQRLDLNDSSVWVANSNRQYVGRANTNIHLLDTVVASEGNDLAVVQSGSRVLVVDDADARLDIVNAATAEVTDTVPLPPDNSSVYLAGDNVVIYSQGTGEAWIVPFDSLSDFDADQEPTLNLGADTVISVSPSGMMYGYTPSARRVSRVNAAVAGVIEQSTSGGFTSTTGDYSITSVGSHWAVLDSLGGELSVDGRMMSVGSLVADGGVPQLQLPSQGGDHVLLGVRGGLVSVPVSGGSPSIVVEGKGGSAARPATFGGCDFGAWSSGVAWRHCATDPASGSTLPLAGIGASPRLSFLSNGDRLVVNDARAGASWAVLDDAQLIDNWDDLIDEDKKDTTVKANDPDNPTEVEKNQKPPVAVDDELGARPGRTTVLPLLLNDYDPNGDVLVIESTGDIAAGVGRLDIVNNRQQAQLTLGDDARGTVVFTYTISDGRGGTATATVTVTVRRADENSAPRQVRSTKVSVAAGAQQSLPVLGDWVDPDGDPFYLTSASVAKPDSVSYKPEGTIIFTASGTDDGTVPVTLVVSDGTDEGTGSVTVRVRPAGKVPIVADPFVVRAYAGQEITVSPLEHVRGGTGVLRLNAVPAKSGVTITPSYENGTFRFSSEDVRTHYLEYIVTDNDQTATGLIRVDVAAPLESNTKPITVPKTIFVRTLSSGIVNVAATDIDPAGGVLLVTRVATLPVRSGVRAEVLQQKSVRITLVGLLDGPVVVKYQVSNGLSEVDGTITVIEIPRPRKIQPPVARDDTATARVGDAITIDVMANDEQPDGLAITMVPKLVQPLTGASGLLFASGNTLRYLAPANPGNFSAVYAIVGPDGQVAQAQVRIEVREPNAETNNPPVPTTVTARVLAGERVRVDIPLTGIDPDGDSVQLLGQQSNPEKGAVASVGTSTIDYEAGQYSAGTDTFTYAVIDALGARATGTVRIGISPRQQGARNPVAIEDEVTARPGATVSVQVLENDSDPDGSPLTVTSVEPSDAETVATIEGAGSIVTITPPAVNGRYGILYTIENRFGGTSSNFITVRVSEDAPLAYPIANDTVLTLSDVLDRESLDVDVLKNVFFADGATRSLGLSVLSGYGGTAEVTTDKRIRVSIADASQIIPFVVSHPDDPTVRSYAFLWVPGFDDALPQLNRNAPALTVLSEETLTINLSDYVLAVNGRKVRLTDSSTVRATHANGASLVVDSDTVQFVSADHYAGPASISFEVTDGASGSDPSGRKAILVLPITVTPRANQPPVFAGAVIEFEPGQRRTIDLGKLTNYPYPQDLGQLVYTPFGTDPRGFTFTIAGRTLQLKANEDASSGSTAALSLNVRDDLTVGQPGRIELRVVPSTRPLASPVADVARTERGRTTVVDVLQNDEATNPFPGQPLRVVRVAGLEGGNLPPGVAVVASNNGSRLTVTVAADAEPIDTNLQYQVADATNDPDRFTFGTVRISVQDVPDAPARPVRQADSFVGGELKLRIAPPQSNNAPITGYRVVSASHGDYSQDCGTTLICSLEGLQVGAEYRFSVLATNDIGSSEPSALSDVYTVDYKPAAPTSVSAVPSPATAAPNGKSITISWPTVPNPNPGTDVTGYTVEVSGADVSFTANATSPFTTTAGGQLSNGVNYTVSVYARNRAQVISESEWRRASTDVRPVGPPSQPDPRPTAVLNADNANGEVRVTWGSSDSNGGGPVTYSVGRITDKALPDSCTTGKKIGVEQGSGGPVASGWIDSNTTDGARYTYIVYADNGLYCTATATDPIESARPPGQASGSAIIAQRTPGGGQFDILAGGDVEASGIVDHFEYRLNGSSSWKNIPGDRYLTSRSDSSYYGLDVTVTYRACRDSGTTLCGDESPGTTVTPVNVRAGIQSCIVGSVPLPKAPQNAGQVQLSYAYSYQGSILGIPVDKWTEYDSDPDKEVPEGSVRVRVKATAIIGADRLEDSGYTEASCN